MRASTAAGQGASFFRRFTVSGQNEQESQDAGGGGASGTGAAGVGSISGGMDGADEAKRETGWPTTPATTVAAVVATEEGRLGDVSQAVELTLTTGSSSSMRQQQHDSVISAETAAVAGVTDECNMEGVELEEVGTVVEHGRSDGVAMSAL